MVSSKVLSFLTVLSFNLVASQIRIFYASLNCRSLYSILSIGTSFYQFVYYLYTATAYVRIMIEIDSVSSEFKRLIFRNLMICFCSRFI